MNTVLTAVKDGWLWATAAVEAHPHLALAALLVLALAAVL
jgi:hypothetical protein